MPNVVSKVIIAPVKIKMLKKVSTFIIIFTLRIVVSPFTPIPFFVSWSEKPARNTLPNESMRIAAISTKGETVIPIKATPAGGYYFVRW